MQEKQFNFESRFVPVNGCPSALAHLYENEPPPPGSFGFHPRLADKLLVRKSGTGYRILYHQKDVPGWGENFILLKYDPETDQVAGKFVDQQEAEAFQQKAPTKKRTFRKIDVAITLVARNPELDDAEIARRTGCDRSHLTRSKEYQRNAEMARRALARLPQKDRAQYYSRNGQNHPTTTDPEIDC